MHTVGGELCTPGRSTFGRHSHKANRAHHSSHGDDSVVLAALCHGLGNQRQLEAAWHPRHLCQCTSLIRHRQVCIRQPPLLLLGQGDVGHLVSPWLGFAGSKRLDSLDLCADPERLHAHRTRHDSSTASTFQSRAAHVHPFRTCLMTCLTSICIT